MKTLEQVQKMYKSQTIDGRDIGRLVQFIPEADMPLFGMKLTDEYKDKHQHVPMTRDAVLSQLADDVAFGFKKALGKRGISASCMAEVVKMWNWILEEGLEDFDNYPQYGLPIFKSTAVKYGFPNPIGNDTGKERKYED
jgi:hypothetical protein